MDLNLENQYKEEFSRDPRVFLPLFDDSFSGLFRYVARRVSDEVVCEQVVGLVYLDAVGQMGTCPRDINFLTWLFTLARLRVSEYVKKSVVVPNTTLSSPVFDGAGIVDGVYDDEMNLKRRAEAFFSMMTFEEQEILRLKFFEELTDGEVMYVLGMASGVVGAKIYKVLKRGYEILFGQVSSDAGVYFGELHSFLTRLKNVEKIPVSEGFKLKLRSEVENKVQKMYVESFSSDSKTADSRQAYENGGVSGSRGVGSSDPAKAFVYAAKGMSKEEVEKITEEYVKNRDFAKSAEGAESVGAGYGATGAGFADGAKFDDVEFGKEGLERELEVDEIAFDRSVAGVAEDVPVNYVDNDSNEYLRESQAFRGGFSNAWERWREFMALIPSTMFVAAIVAVIGIVWFGRAQDEGVTGLPFRIDYSIGFQADYDEKVLIETDLIAKIAKGRNVDHAYVSGADDQGNLSISMVFEEGDIFDYLLEKDERDVYMIVEFEKK